MTDQTVSILGGTGQLGFGLALRLAASGTAVVIGSRDAARAEEAAARIREQVPAADVRGDDNAAATAAATEIVVLAVPFASSAATVKSVAGSLRAGQIVLDATVPLAPAVGGKPVHLLGVWQGSAAEQTQSLVPDGVHVVAALHTVSAADLADLTASLDQDTLVCGDRKADKQQVMTLIDGLGAGLRAVDAGRLELSRLVEGLTPLLIGINIRHKTHAGIRITGV